MEFKRGDLVMHRRNPEVRTGIVLEVREDPRIRGCQLVRSQVGFSTGGRGWFAGWRLRLLTVDTARSAP